jgi:hypothetical protein
VRFTAAARTCNCSRSHAPDEWTTVHLRRKRRCEEERNNRELSLQLPATLASASASAAAAAAAAAAAPREAEVEDELVEAGQATLDAPHDKTHSSTKSALAPPGTDVARLNGAEDGALTFEAGVVKGVTGHGRARRWDVRFQPSGMTCTVGEKDIRAADCAGIASDAADSVLDTRVAVRLAKVDGKPQWFLGTVTERRRGGWRVMFDNGDV